MHPHDVETTVKEIKRIAHKNTQILHFENRCRCKDGSYKWLEWTATSVNYLLYTVARDVTERKQAEKEREQRLLAETLAEELALARDEAVKANQLKFELLAKVSHELRTPLGAILGFAEMLDLNRYGEVIAEQSETPPEIINRTKYLTNLINELLDQMK